MTHTCRNTEAEIQYDGGHGGMDLQEIRWIQSKIDTKRSELLRGGSFWLHGKERTFEYFLQDTDDAEIIKFRESGKPVLQAYVAGEMPYKTKIAVKNFLEWTLRVYADTLNYIEGISE